MKRIFLKRIIMIRKRPKMTKINQLIRRRKKKRNSKKMNLEIFKCLTSHRNRNRNKARNKT